MTLHLYLTGVIVLNVELVLKSFNLLIAFKLLSVLTSLNPEVQFQQELLRDQIQTTNNAPNTMFLGPRRMNNEFVESISQELYLTLIKE